MSNDAAKNKISFGADSGFHAALKKRVSLYFEENSVSPRGDWRMVVKTAVLLSWFLGSYSCLVFAAHTWWQTALCSVLLALAMGGIGFSVQHDANHGSYSNSGTANRLLGLGLDLLGGSSYLWRIKHNISHHTYTNLRGADDDIDVEPLARLMPAQPRHWFHRLQHFYIIPVYGFLVPRWHFFTDLKALVLRRTANTRVALPAGVELVEMVLGKVVFLGWAFAIPALVHPLWLVFTVYLATALTLGVVLSVTFQLAHCVEEAAFPEAAPGNNRVAGGWAEHQVRTTVDFAHGNRLLTWYVGGLNYQIEHHLFPRICHVHYPQIAKIVRATCSEFGLRYASHPTLRSAVASHWRWLRRMGKLPGVAPVPAPQSVGKSDEEPANPLPNLHGAV